MQRQKEFLTYFYSDEGALIWMNEKHELAPQSLDDESKLDMSGWDEWDKSVYQVAQGVTFRLIKLANKSKVFEMSGKDMFANVSILNSLCASNEKDQLDKDGIWTAMCKIIADNWGVWMNA